MHTALANQPKGPCKTIWVIRTLRIIKPFALEVQFLGNKNQEQYPSDCTRRMFKNLLVVRFSNIRYQKCWGYHFRRDSSVGRAAGWSPVCRWFDSPSRHDPLVYQPYGDTTWHKNTIRAGHRPGHHEVCVTFMRYSQVVRQRTLTPWRVGSNPAISISEV